MKQKAKTFATLAILAVLVGLLVYAGHAAAPYRPAPAKAPTVAELQKQLATKTTADTKGAERKKAAKQAAEQAEDAAKPRPVTPPATPAPVNQPARPAPVVQSPTTTPSRPNTPAAPAPQAATTLPNTGPATSVFTFFLLATTLSTLLYQAMLRLRRPRSAQ